MTKKKAIKKKGKSPVKSVNSRTSPHIKAVRRELAKLRKKVRKL